MDKARKEKLINEDVKDYLDQSKYKVGIAGCSIAINNISELEKELEVIKRVFKKKPFAGLRVEMEWR